MSKQALMYVAFVALAAMAYTAGVALIVSPGNFSWMLLALPVVVSPVAMVILRTRIERLPIGTAGDPRTQSWAYLFGDSIFLPIALLAVGMGYQNVSNGFFTSTLWILASLLIGAAAGTGFHVVDGRGYRNAGAQKALLAPTKLWHDYVVYPVLFGLLFMGGLPQLLPSAWSLWTLVTLGGIVGWAVLGLYFDQKRTINPLDLHPRWNSQQFAVHT